MTLRPVAGFNGVAVESQVLKDRGLLGPVISTMLRARKSTSRKIYHRTWRAYISGGLVLQFSLLSHP